MSNRRQFYIFNDEATLKRVQQEFEDSGRYVKREGNELTIYGVIPRKTKKAEEEAKAAQRLSKREREEGVIPRD